MEDLLKMSSSDAATTASLQLSSSRSTALQSTVAATCVWRTRERRCEATCRQGLRVWTRPAAAIAREREVEDGHGGRANSSTGGRISRKGREEVNDGSFFLLDEGGELGVS
jgi:hypothetical protein